jgi:formate C-acetyltransferase
MISDLNAVGRAHERYHPTPLTSLFIDGCLSSGRCSTAGGARYNSPGVQGVGISTAGDSLCAIERLVFQDKKISLVRLRKILAPRKADADWFTLCAKLEVRTMSMAVHWTRFVVNEYARIVRTQGKNTRSGQYQAGFITIPRCAFRKNRRPSSGRLKGKLSTG